jgi:sugar lactone lactonase YvrE
MNTHHLLHLLGRRRLLTRAAGLALAAVSLLLASMVDGATTNFNLYVANTLAYESSPFTRYFTVEVFDSLGNANVFATNSSFSNPILSAPGSVAIDGSGNVYVVCTQDNTWIEKFDPWGNHATRFVNNAGSYPNDLVFDRSGNLYVAEDYGAGVERFDTNGVSSLFATFPGAPVGLAFDAAGNLYVSDYYFSTIWKIDTNANPTKFATPGNNPYGMAFDNSGNLYVALHGNGEIVKYTPPSTNETLVASLGSSTQPVGLAFDPDGNLYVSEYAANTIVKIDPQTNVTVFASKGLNGPSFIVLQPQPYRVDRFVVAGGGGTSSNSEWILSGTAGQSDAGIMAGQFMNGELVGIEGGFWAGPGGSLPVVSTNLLVNGSFELGSFVNQEGASVAMLLYPGATNILGWTVTGTTGYSLGWLGPNGNLGLSAADGNYFLDLTGYHDAVPYNGVSQTVATTIGQRYSVSFEIGSSANYDGSPPAISVAVTGQPTLTNTSVVSGINMWKTFEFSFTATAASTVLTFTGVTPQNVAYIGLDHVVMWASAASPVILMSAPKAAGGEVTLPFTLESGSAATFELLQTTNLADPWVTNSSASLTATISNVSYYFTVPTNGAAEFYRVQTP